MNDKPSTAAELIRWANEQRAAYRRGELNRVRIRKLESIPGWQWERDELVPVDNDVTVQTQEDA